MTMQSNQHQIRLRRPRVFGGVRVQELVVIAGAVVALFALLTLSLVSGSYGLSVAEVVTTLAGQPPTEMAGTVVWDFRLPRALVAFLSGGLLGLSGALLQAVTRNALADPSLLGISQGASVAVVALAILAPELPYSLRPPLAFAGGLLTAALIRLASGNRTESETLRFILIGIGLSSFFTALISVLLTYGNVNRALSALGWLAGSVHAASYDEVYWLSGLSLLLVPILFFVVRPLSALRFDLNTSTALGVHVSRDRAFVVVFAVLLAALAVAAVGPLGFVGLVAPHLAHRLVRAGLGRHLLLSFLTGALLVGVADLIGRLAFAPLQIPAGLMTAIVGVPVFVVLLIQRRGGSLPQ